jgi:hypothetical protein
MSFLKKLRTYIKRNKLALSFYEFIFQREIVNFFNIKSDKKVLFSYSTYHFNNKNYVKHSNYSESLIIADIFNELGYQVDIVNNNRPTKKKLNEYDVIFGEGIPIYQSINSQTKSLKIYYGTGSHPFHCTQQSYIRLIEYYQKNTFLAKKSLRTNEADWGVAASLADAVICIGNETTKSTFLSHGAKNVFTVDPTFHPRSDALEIGIRKDFSQCRKSILWFGSYGLLHKGLDLAIEAARANPTWALHICGYTADESDFIDSLTIPNNVIVHGFINVYSEEFRQICLDCGFVLLPSCSEGIATAVLTAVANGAMIPIVTKECGVDIGDNGFFIGLQVEDIQLAMNTISTLEESRLKEMSIAIQALTLQRYTVDNYISKMKTNILGIINSEKAFS